MSSTSNATPIAPESTQEQHRPNNIQYTEAGRTWLAEIKQASSVSDKAMDAVGPAPLDKPVWATHARLIGMSGSPDVIMSFTSTIGNEESDSWVRITHDAIITVDAEPDTILGYIEDLPIRFEYAEEPNRTIAASMDLARNIDRAVEIVVKSAPTSMGMGDAFVWVKANDVDLTDMLGLGAAASIAEGAR